jgi:hypothetical protein
MQVVADSISPEFGNKTDSLKRERKRLDGVGPFSERELDEAIRNRPTALFCSCYSAPAHGTKSHAAEQDPF